MPSGGQILNFTLQVRLGTHALDDLRARQSFRNRDPVENGLAFDQRLEHLAQTSLPTDLEFARLELHRLAIRQAAVEPLGQVVGHEQPPIGNDALPLESAGDLVDALALGNDGHGCMTERTRLLEACTQRQCYGAGDQQQQESE